MKSIMKMNPFELKAEVRKRHPDIEISKKATKAELLELLGVKQEKKGKRSWKPAQKLDVRDKQDGFRYRFRDKDPQNIQRARAEGWEFVNPITGIPGEHVDPEDAQKDLTSTTEYRELTLMALPEDIAQSRDEHFRELTRNQTVGLKDRLQGDLDKEAPEGHKTSATGSIVID